MTTERKATLIIEGRDPVEFPIMTPVIGNDCIDIRALAAKTGMFSTPGFCRRRMPVEDHVY
ncbi:hypothetical protein [Propionivibrio sp.]|uniref:hypothetical protein n=1 Tax=Propionivibrio sp. TaxID=2212460 RepID=UPI00345AF5F5